MITVRCLGAAQEVTGSMHLVESPAGKILIDCGFFQGKRDESRQRNRSLPKEAVAADTVILTHAHIDHSGSLPTLHKLGFKGRIWATPATRDLCDYMLRDSARIQKGDADHLNRKFMDDPEFVPVEPIYDEDDAIATVKRFESVPYATEFSPLPGVKATFLDAGHILGSAQVVLTLSDGKNEKRLVFSGDLGRRGLPILRDPEHPGRADFAFMESTYGNRAHGSIEEMHTRLAEVVNRTIEKHGKIIIPAFAVGRTQEVIYALNELYLQKRIPEIPVFVDSPLGIQVTEVFKKHPECYDEETRAFVESNGSPFSFKSLRYCETREQSMALNDLKEPAIIVASSGMCEAGRVLHHLAHNVSDEKNTILIVGYQAQHTLGRRLVEKRKQVRILGVERELFANVVVINAFSAHGDMNDLHEYAEKLQGTRQLFLIHGEVDQQMPLAEDLKKRGMNVSVPKRGDALPLE